LLGNNKKENAVNKLIDLGCHVFEGLNTILKNGVVDSSYSVYCFEPNPNVFPHTKARLENVSKKFCSVQLHNLAISDKDGTVTFNLDQSKTNQACNILDNPPDRDVLWGGQYIWSKTNVDSVSAKTLMKLCDVQPDDQVKIKCDIEGAEFVFLNNLLACENLSPIKEMLIEWHDRFWYPNHQAKEREKDELVRRLTERGIVVKYWH